MTKKEAPKLTRSIPRGFKTRAQRAAEKQKQKDELLVLCDLYGISRDDEPFFHLAKVLAHHVYTEPIPRGAKPKWTSKNGAFLVVEVLSMLETETGARLKIKGICKLLARKEPWSLFVYADSADPGETLRKAYYRYKNHEKVKYAMAAKKALEKKDAEEIWSKHVRMSLGL